MGNVSVTCRTPRRPVALAVFLILITTHSGSAFTGPRLHWEPLYEPGSGGAITSLCVSPFDHNRVLVGGDMLGIGLSEDRGEHWQATFGLTAYEISAFTWHPTARNTVWAGTMMGPFVSTDGGRNWQSKRNGMPEFAWGGYSCPIEKIIFDPNHSTRLLAFGGSRRHWGVPADHAPWTIWESQDSGDHWTKLAQIGDKGVNVLAAAFAAGSSTVVYLAADAGGVYKSVDGGKTWAQANAGLPNQNIHHLRVHPTNSDILWITLGKGGVYKSTDGARSWRPSGQGLSHDGEYYALAVCQSAPDNLITCDFNYRGGTIYRSTDGGATWKGEMDGSNFVRAYAAGPQWGQLEFDPRDPHTAFAGNTETIQRTVDGGKTWTDTSSHQPHGKDGGWRGNGYSGLCALKFRFNPYNPKDAAFVAMDNGNLWLSRDGMQTWTWADHGIPTWGGVSDMAFTDAAGHYQVNPAANDLEVDTPSGKSSSACRVTTKAGSVIYAVQREGGKLYKQVNGGAWSLVREQEAMSTVATDPSDPMRVMFCTHDNPYHDVIRATGVWASDDGGQTWSQQNDGLGMLRGDVLVVDPHNPTQWIFGSNGRGYWVTTWPHPVATPLAPAHKLAPSHGTAAETGTASVVAEPGLAENGSAVRRISPAKPLAPLTWTPLGEPGFCGVISAVAISPHDGRRLLAGGTMHGLAVSEDGGATWQPGAGLTSWEVADFTFHPTDPRTVWVGTMSGPFVSTDGGHSWSARRKGLPSNTKPRYSAPIQRVIFDPNNSRRLLAFGGSKSGWGGPSDALWGAVWESSDSGENWKQLATLPDSGNVVTASFGAGSSSVVYAAVRDKGVFASADGGASWTPRHDGLPGLGVTDLLSSLRDPHTLWAALGPHGVYKSQDGGVNWRAAGSAGDVAALSADGPEMLLAAGAHGNLVKSADSGETWQRLTDSTSPGAFATDFTATSIAFDPSRPDHFLIGGDSFLLSTGDGGRSWTDAAAAQDGAGRWHGRGISGLLATSVAFNPAAPGQVALTAWNQGNFWLSQNGGGTWTRGEGLPASGGGERVAFTAGRTLYVALGQQGHFGGLARSEDDGVHWTLLAGPEHGLPQIGNAQGCGGLYALPNEPKTAWVTLGIQLFTTTDGGEHWSLAFNGPSGPIVPGVGHPRDFFVTGEGGIYHTRDGLKFTRSTGGPGPISALAADNSDPARLYAVVGRTGKSQDGLWRLRGDTWTQLAAETFISGVAVDPANSNRLAFTTHDDPYKDISGASGVWLSQDAGATWVAANNGLGCQRGQVIAFDPHDSQRLIFGSIGQGFSTLVWPPNLALSNQSGARRRALAPAVTLKAVISAQMGSPFAELQGVRKYGDQRSFLGPFEPPCIFAAIQYRGGGEGTGYHDLTKGYGPFGPGHGNQQWVRNDDVEIDWCYWDRAFDGSQDATHARDGSVCFPGCGDFDVMMAQTEWLAYALQIQATGAFATTLRVCAGSPGGVMHIEVDGKDVTGPLTVPADHGWHKFFDLAAPQPITLEKGVHTLKVVCDKIRDEVELHYVLLKPQGN